MFTTRQSFLPNARQEIRLIESYICADYIQGNTQIFLLPEKRGNEIAIIMKNHFITNTILQFVSYVLAKTDRAWKKREKEKITIATEKENRKMLCLVFGLCSTPKSI